MSSDDVAVECSCGACARVFGEAHFAVERSALEHEVLPQKGVSSAAGHGSGSHVGCCDFECHR